MAGPEDGRMRNEQPSPPSFAPADWNPSAPQGSYPPAARTGRGKAAVAAFAGLVVVAFVVTSMVASLAVGVSSISSLALVYGLTLIARGRGHRWIPKDIRVSGSAAAVRCLGALVVVWSGYGLLLASQGSQPHGPPSWFSWYAEPLMWIVACGGWSLVSWLSWRAIRRNPAHPAYATTRPYFAGAAPTTRTGGIAVALGVLSLVLTVAPAFPFGGLSVVTIPLGVAAAGVGLAALLRALVRGPASKAAPLLGIVTGLGGLFLTATVGGDSSLDALTCQSVTSCLAVGNRTTPGFIVPVVNGTAGTRVQVDGGARLTGLACPTPDRCVAVGSDHDNTGGSVVPLVRDRSGGWVIVSVQRVASPLQGVACTSSAVCVAVGDGVVVISNGRAGPVQSTKGVHLRAIACPTAVTCEAVGGIDPAGNPPAVWAPITSGILGPVHPVGGAEWLTDIACPTASVCVAVGEAGGFGAVVPITDGIVGPVQRVGAVIEATSVACPAVGVCAVVGMATAGVGPAQAFVPFIAGQQGAAQVFAGGTAQPRVACISRSLCLMTGTLQNDGVTPASLS